MKEYVGELTKNVSERFGRVAQDYLTSGFDLFHRCLEGDSSYCQASVGMITTGVEMLLKSYTAHKNLSSVFNTMPNEVRLMLNNPGGIPRFFKWRTFTFNIHSSAFSSLTLPQCADAFYVFFPHMKQVLMTHIETLVKLQNPSLHEIVSSLSTFELGRIGYSALTISQSIANDDTFSYSWYTPTENDLEFLRDFEMKREERVQLAFAQAKQLALESSIDDVHGFFARDWNSLATPCPVCHSVGLLAGYTERAVGEDDDGPFPTLDFFAVSFRCDECRLTLYDSEELRLAGMDTIYDRSNDIDRWFREHGSFLDPDIDGGS